MRAADSLLAFVVLMCMFAGSSASADQPGFLDELVLTVDLPAGFDYELKATPLGQKLEFEGCGYKTRPGSPMLPTKTFLVGLPPGTRASSVEIMLSGARPVPGAFKLITTPHPVALSGEKRQVTPGVQVEGPGWLSGGGTLREYGYAAVTVCPCAYDDRTGEITCHGAAEISLTLEPDPDFEWTAVAAAQAPGRAGEERARKTFVNFDEINPLYEARRLPPGDILTGAPLEINDYVIITTSTLAAAVTSSDFVALKTTLGYSVRIVLITDPEIAGQPGGDLAEQIRNFLRAYYLTWGIEYVLMVGDYVTVPMRYCYPDPSNHTNTAGTPGGTGGEVPTDYYYADLSNSDALSWDSDGDGFYGEYGEDSPDFMPEVYVGRIPVNNAARITAALNKIVAFELDNGAWKENAIHASAFWYFTHELSDTTPCMDAAHYLSYIEADIMSGWTVTRFSEQSGLEVSAYPWPAITETAFSTAWRTGQHAVVNWGAHGWTNSIARKVWDYDDGDGIPEAHEISWPPMLSTSSSLDDDYPSIVTSASCLVGCPEPNEYGNMGIKMLVIPGWGPAVAVIASARSPYGTAYWPPGGSESIIYEFNDLMITEFEKVGEAFYNSKFYCTTNYGWAHYAEYINMYTFNLWGEPSLTREGVELSGINPGTDGPGPAGRLTMRVWPSPSRGAVNIDYYQPAPASPRVEVFDVLGRRVSSVEAGESGKGTHSLAWDGSRDGGAPAAAGIYWIRMTLGDQSVARRIVLVR